MAITLKRHRAQTFDEDAAQGNSFVVRYRVSGYGLGLGGGAILDAARSVTTSAPVPDLGELEDGVPLRRVRVVPVAANVAYIYCYFSVSTLSFGGAQYRRAAGSFGRESTIQIPVFRPKYTDIAGTQLVYVPDFVTRRRPVQSRWYDGVPVALQSQDPTPQQIEVALEDNMGRVRDMGSGRYMELVDYERISADGQLPRVRLRFEAAAAVPGYGSGYFGTSHPPIPALPAGAIYIYDAYPPPNTSPVISTKTLNQQLSPWVDLPFRVECNDGRTIT